MIADQLKPAEALREALAATIAGSRVLRLGGYARPPGESLRPLAIDNSFVERCRVAVHKLVGLDDEGLIAITSARRKEGRSSVAAAVATALARTRGRGGALLVDLDFERPSQAELFAVAPAPGLADFMDEGGRLRLVFGGPGRQLALLPAGERRGDSARLLHEFDRCGLLGVLREQFQWVVVDLPPLDRNPEVVGLATQVDWHIVVGWHRRTTVSDLRNVHEQLPNKNRVGFLLTGDSTGIPGRIRRLL